MRILVIDDADDIRLLMRTVLSGVGYDVIEAESGARALAILASDRPDMVVLDVQMPEMDGWETLSAIRSDPMTARLPVVMCTVKSQEADLERGRALGCDGYISKPFDIGELIAVTGGLLVR